jgi:hypothetical protein
VNLIITHFVEGDVVFVSLSILASSLTSSPNVNSKWLLNLDSRSGVVDTEEEEEKVEGEGAKVVSDADDCNSDDELGWLKNGREFSNPVLSRIGKLLTTCESKK